MKGIGIFGSDRVTEQVNDIHYKSHFWHRITGQDADRFARQVSSAQGTPIITFYDGQEVLVYKNHTWAKGKKVGSITVTPEQLENRPEATRLRVRVRNCLRR